MQVPARLTLIAENRAQAQGSELCCKIFSIKSSVNKSVDLKFHYFTKKLLQFLVVNNQIVIICDLIVTNWNIPHVNTMKSVYP